MMKSQISVRDPIRRNGSRCGGHELVTVHGRIHWNSSVHLEVLQPVAQRRSWDADGRSEGWVAGYHRAHPSSAA
jgi:hypothetical protein